MFIFKLISSKMLKVLQADYIKIVKVEKVCKQLGKCPKNVGGVEVSLRTACSCQKKASAKCSLGFLNSK